MIKNPIFIIGCSRSGTCFLGEVLKKHPKIHCLIEQPEVFKLATQLALNPCEKNHPNIISKLQNTYAKSWKKNFWTCAKCSSKCKKAGNVKKIFSTCQQKNITRYADKSHQHVLNTDILLKAFPGAQFIHIIRDGRDVVSSMLKHQSIPRRFSEKYISATSNWPQRWYGVQNFEHYQKWKKFTLAQKCALAWVSRIETGQKASKNKSRKQWLEIKYEDLVTNPLESAALIYAFLDLEIDNSHIQTAKKSSIGNWKTQISPQALNEAINIMENTLRVLNYKI